MTVRDEIQRGSDAFRLTNKPVVDPEPDNGSDLVGDFVWNACNQVPPVSREQEMREKGTPLPTYKDPRAALGWPAERFQRGRPAPPQ